MPGHILYAQCPCGFERKLSPGSKIAAADFVDYKIAYNADESDLLSENERDHQVAGPSYRSKPVSIRFQTRFYPCPHANFERKNAAQGPYLCPQCKTASLTLLFFSPANGARASEAQPPELCWIWLAQPSFPPFTVDMLAHNAR